MSFLTLQTAELERSARMLDSIFVFCSTSIAACTSCHALTDCNKATYLINDGSIDLQHRWSRLLAPIEKDDDSGGRENSQ